MPTGPVIAFPPAPDFRGDTSYVATRDATTSAAPAGGGEASAPRRRGHDLAEGAEVTDLLAFDGLTTSGDPFHPTPRRQPLQMRGEKHHLSRQRNRLVARVPAQ